MPRGPIKSVDKARDFKGTIKKLLKYIKSYRLEIIIVMIFATLSIIFSIMGPKILGSVTTSIFDGVINKITGNGSIDFTFIKNTLLVLLGLYLFSTLCTFIQSYIMNSVSCKISYNLRNDISKKIHKLPLAYFESRTKGEILSRITNDVDTFSSNLSQTLSETVSSIATLVGVLVMMINISIEMTIASILILPISIFGMGFIMKKSQKFFIRQQKDLGNINGVVEEVYSGHDVVTVFNAEEKEIKRFEELNEKLYDSGWKSQLASTAMHPLMNFVGNINYVFVSIYGGYLTIKERIQVGDILSFSSYVKNLNRSISNIAQIFGMLQPTVAAAERVFEFLEEQEEVKDVKNSTSIENIEGNVEFKNVKIGYTKDKTIINDFSAKIKKGQKIAIVGPTGAGKTTMVKLLMRFYDIDNGSISIDGVDIRNFKRRFRGLGKRCLNY